MRVSFAGFIGAFAVLAAAAPHVDQRAGVKIPVAKRAGLVNNDKTVNIEALNAHLASVKAKILRGLNSFEKNTGTPHPSALNKSQRRATGAVPLTDSSGQLWFGTVSVGTPLADFTVDFDTGSSDFFLPGPKCTVNCDGHTIYDPSASSTSQDLGQTFKLEYGDKSTVSGEQYSDTVSVAGLTAVSQVLGAATVYSDGFAINQFPPDGLMGLAFPSIAVFSPSPVFDSLVSQGQTDQSVFSFKLASSGSELFLGGANPALYTGEFTYVPVTKAGFWQVTMDSVEGNGQSILSNVDSIIDTGTSLVIGTPSQVATFYQALGGTDASSTAGPGFYTFPCDSFPSVSFTFGGTSFPISADTLNLGSVSSGSSDCVSGIVGQDTGSNFWVVGDVFLQSVYTTFDLGNQRVGFATLA